MKKVLKNNKPYEYNNEFKKISNNYCIFLSFIMLIVFPEVILSKRIFPRKLNLDSEIIMLISGTGEQRILHESFQSLPTEIYANNKSQEISTTVKDLNLEENEIRMKWNYSLTTCNSMFNGLRNIIKMDFSKFDTSHVKEMHSMFRDCSSLTSLDLSNFNTSSVTTMGAMFFSCYSLRYLNLDNFDSSNVVDMQATFYNCSLLTSLNLSSFYTPSLRYVNSMFHDCASLKYLNMENFNTSSIINMLLFFYNCSSMTSFDVSKFNTKNVQNMQGMFGQCHSLISLDLSNFITSSVTNMEGMFGGSYQLLSLDLTNFDMSLVTNMLGMFFDLKSIVYLNLDNFKETKENITTLNMFSNINTQLLICLDTDDNPKISAAIPSNILNNNNNCDNMCFDETTKIILNDKTCVEDCLNTLYKYEFNKICYDNCPENTHSLFNNEFICEDNFKCKKLKKYYDYNQVNCIDEIPEGYFLNDTIYNTIDKCHQDCKSCDKKNNDTNSNCNSCLNDKFFYWGNCLSNCVNDYYTDSSGKNICKCISNNKCKDCLPDNLDSDLCISCNTGYYQKIDDIQSDNSLIKCYKDPEGYYLDNDIYKPCYPSCKKCSELGDINDHKCIECISDYGFKDTKKYCYKNCLFYYYYDSSNNYQCTEINECPENFKLIKEKMKCIDECINDDTYQIEFNNTCYKSCPEGTKLSEDNDHLCLLECPENKPYESQNGECTQECNAIDFFNGICKINNNSPATIDDMIKTIKNQLNETLDEFMNNITNSEHKDLLIKAKDATYQITTTDNQKNKDYEDVSVINLGECENILKKNHNIDPSKSLLIFKIDYYVPGLSIPVIGYEVYHPDTKEKLELSECKDALIDLDIPVSINEDLLFKYDPENEYYVDECYPYTSENGTDIILNDRRQEYIDNNMSLCENKCSYNGYDEDTKKVSCVCEPKSKEYLISDIIDDEELLANNLTVYNSSSSIMKMKCIYTVFSKEGLKQNYANYILASVLISLIVLIVLFYKVGYYSLEKMMTTFLDIKKKGQNNMIENKNEKIKIKKKKKKKKEKQINSNPVQKKQKKLTFKAGERKDSRKESSKSSKSDLKNTNIFINLEKEESNNNNIEIYKKCIDQNQSSIKSKSQINKSNIIKIPNMNYCDVELNSFTYEEALELDKRTYSQYYFSLLKTKHPLIFSFCPMEDYNTVIIKVSIFLLSFTIYFAINALLFTDSTIHKIYEDQGAYNFGYQIKNILIAFIISYILSNIIKYFFVSERDILKIQYEINVETACDKVEELKKCIVIKYTSFFIIGIVFVIFFWYYLSSFCAVYKNSQICLIINTTICFSLSFLYPLIINLVPGIFRIVSLKDKNNKLLFKISRIIQFL